MGDAGHSGKNRQADPLNEAFSPDERDYYSKPVLDSSRGQADFLKNLAGGASPDDVNICHMAKSGTEISDDRWYTEPTSEGIVCTPTR